MYTIISPPVILLRNDVATVFISEPGNKFFNQSGRIHEITGKNDSNHISIGIYRFLLNGLNNRNNLRLSEQFF
ncbi:MAG: hypothetical protein C0403_11620 [Desulfobacterium sp.]|nr:hypothetical protein [Desulfobacterium sp.]